MKYIISDQPPPDFNAPDWEYVGSTPGNGQSYYNERMPAAAVVYRSVVKIYTERKDNSTICQPSYPSDFKICTYYETGEKKRRI